jgi:superfamily II DNA/RNA helicase
LIIVPTRELALQTGTVAKKLLKYSTLKYSLIIGGHDYTGQFEALVSNPDIVIATPGRLLEMVLATQFSFKSLQFLVLDEADQLMEAQYKEQVY